MREIVYGFIIVCFIAILGGCSKLSWDLDKTNDSIEIRLKDVLNITSSGAEVSYSVFSHMESSWESVGVEYWRDSNPADIARREILSRDTTGSIVLDGLLASTNYSFKLFVVRGSEYFFSDDFSFRTLDQQVILPSVSIGSAQNITSNTATVSVSIVTAGQTLSASGILYSTFIGFSSGTIELSQSNSAATSYSMTMSSLTPNTIYYVKAYAEINGVVLYSNIGSFITDNASTTGILVGTNSCSNLTGFTTLFSGINGATGNWGVDNAYLGNGLVAPAPGSSGNLGITSGNHYIVFNKQFQNMGYIEFWCNSYNPGFNNIIPKISVNGGLLQQATMIGGQTSSFYFQKVRSQTIPAGTNQIRIEFNGGNCVFKVDEIEFYEYN